MTELEAAQQKRIAELEEELAVMTRRKPISNRVWRGAGRRAKLAA